MRRSERLAALAVLSGATLVAMTPILAHRALPYASDTAFAVQCANGFVAAIREGALMPRWLGDANLGFGGPTFVLYPPLGFYLVAAADAVTGSTIDAIRLVLLVGTAATALSFFASARDLAGAPAAAVGAAVYTLLPYHLIDVYERFAFAEYLAFAWLPILFRAVRRLGDGPSLGAWLALAGAYAGLVLTHVLTAYAVLLVLVPYAAAIAWQRRRPRLLLELASAGAVAVLCCGAYVVPALFERAETNQAFYLGGKYAWWLNFLFRDETAFGAAADPTKPLVTAAAISALLVAGTAAWFARSRAATPLHAASATWTLLLETPASASVWAMLPGLATLQFPWRFELLAAFFASLLTVVAVDAPRRPGAAPALAIAGALALGISAIVVRAQPFAFDAAESAKDENRLRFVVEHMPAGVRFADSWARLPWRQPEAFVGGGTTVETLAWTSESRRLRVVAPADGSVVLRTFAMSGWRTELDGRPVVHRVDPRFGAIEVDVPAGTHEVAAIYGTTRDRRAGAAASAAGLVIVVAIAAGAWRRRRRLAKAE